MLGPVRWGRVEMSVASYNPGKTGWPLFGLFGTPPLPAPHARVRVVFLAGLMFTLGIHPRTTT